MKDLSPEEAGRWMDAAPKMVQDAVTSPATHQALAELSKRFALHVDVSGLLEKLTSYTLLGYIGPEEFFKELRAAGILEKDARDIMTEVNQKIFMPLRKEEEVGKVAPETPPADVKHPQPVAVKPPQTVAPEPVASASTAAAPAAPEPARHFRLENKISPRPATVAPISSKVAMSRPAVAPSAVVPQVVRMTGTLSDAVRLALANEKQPEPMKLLEDHEEPHIEIPEVRPSSTIPKVEPQPPVVVRPPQPAVPAPANLPGAMPPVAAPILPAVAAPSKVVPATTAVPTVPVAPIKSYSTDPYREPVDEVPGA